MRRPKRDRWRRWLLVAQGFALAAAAQASAAATGRGAGAEGAAGAPGAEAQGRVAPSTEGVETIEGVVASVSLGAGTATLRTDAGSTTLRGVPMDLLELHPGNEVSLTYRSYGGQPWLLPSGDAGLGGGTGSSGWLQTNQPFMTKVGDVRQVDVARGLLDLDGQIFHGHPAVIRQLEVGARATVLFQSFDGRAWITPV